MATTIVTKNGITGTPTGLADGELAVDRAAGKLWVGHAGGVTPIVGGALEGGSADGQTLRWEDSTSTWEATSTLTVSDAGSVGIVAAPIANSMLTLGDGTDDNNAIFTFTNSTGQKRGTFRKQNGVTPIYALADRNDRSIIEYSATNTDGNQYIKFQTNNTAEALRIDGAGNMGFNTTTPTDYGAGFFTLALGNGNTGASGGGILQFQEGGVDQWRIFSFQDDLRFVQSNATGEAMRIDGSGNVGIGVTGINVGALYVDKAPPLDRTLLNLGSSINITGYQRGVLNINGRVNGVDGNASISLVARTLANNNWINGLIEYGQDNYMAFHTNGNAAVAPFERMRIDSSGNLLVGTTTPISPGGGNLECTGILRGQNSYDTTVGTAANVRIAADGRLFRSTVALAAQADLDAANAQIATLETQLATLTAAAQGAGWAV